MRISKNDNIKAMLRNAEGRALVCVYDCDFHSIGEIIQRCRQEYFDEKNTWIQEGTVQITKWCGSGETETYNLKGRKQ